VDGHVVVAVGWVHVGSGGLLAVRTRGRDRFYLPGGKPEPGETLPEALTREVREELGVDLEHTAQAFVIEADAHGYDEPTRVTLTCFIGAPKGDPSPAAEIEEMTWLTRADRDRAAPAVQLVLDRVLT
jgi:8-oxo-dGTP pyrophosphatase MutT (NUDIX family)